MDKLTETATNEMLNTELWSSSLHIELQNYLEVEKLPMFASWLDAQIKIKMKRFCRLSRILLKCGGSLSLQRFTCSPHNWRSPLIALNTLLEHERYMEKQIQSFLVLAENSDNIYFATHVIRIYEHETRVSDIFLELLRLFAYEWKHRLPSEFINSTDLPYQP